MTRFVAFFYLLAFVPVPFSYGQSHYNYSYYGEVIHSAPGMTFAQYFNAQTLGVTFSSPEDLKVYEDMIFIVDSSTNQLVVVNPDFSLNEVHQVFSLSPAYAQELADEGITDVLDVSLNTPSGVEVVESGIYICDTGNYRIVKLNHDFEVIAVFDNVEDVTFAEIYFEPKKITVDTSERMYVVAKNVYEGIVEINSDGTFNRYTGVNPLKLTPIEIFQRSIMTEEQLAQMQLYLPTEYTNVVINAENFIYATSKPSENNVENQIQLINPKGVDVISKNGYFPPMGDVQYIEGRNNYVIDGPSSLVDIAITDNGIYTVLDQKRSRLFTYDSEGNLLYINGDEGSQSDKFSEGVAIDYLGDDLLILDRRTKTVVVYRLTEFGSLVNQAIAFHDNGEFEMAAMVWLQVATMNSNYEIAYNGIGKLKLRQEDYKSAMDYFKLGHDQYYYSKAFKAYRNQYIKDHFAIIGGGAVLLVGALVGLRIYKTYKKGGSILYED